ncbi:MAG: M3 family metallopeptidase [Bacteroidales bacterium]|nr:M3 family metallopeptidase [Bacteroidales bacterium]
MKKTIVIVAAAMALSACASHQNPFLTEWDTPYGIPPFDKIEYADYIPAIKEGIKQQQAEVDAIIANPEPATFENTIAAYELTGELLAKVTGVLYNVSETDNCPELEAIIEEATPLMSEHSSNLGLNKALYERVAAVYNADQSALTEEQKTVLKKMYDDFVQGGIALDEASQARIREIDAEMAAKTNKIGNNILAESNAFKAKFGISVSAYPTAMTTTEDRALREEMFKAYSSRGHNANENDNRKLALEVLRLRLEKAKIMGFSNSADFILQNKMAHDHETVDAFLDGIIKASVAKAKEEIVDMQAIMDEDIKAGLLPEGTKIQPWDWWYYAEKVRKAKYDLDEDITKPYFEAGNVRKGIFEAAHRLYGISFEELADVPSYNKDFVQTFKITDADGSLIGIFTTDYFPRDSKRGGAWMNNIREQKVDAEGNDIRPIIVNVGNFTSPDENGVSLLTVDNVETAFHEFGHALHGLLTKCHYPSVSGTNVARDFVETFSQFNENWAFQPELLSFYAKHYQTGEVIPQELVEKIIAASKFNQGFMTTELCAASILDMKWHELTEIPDDENFVDEFEAKVCAEMGLIDEIIPRYRTTYFNHIFSSGYAAGYYGYLWAEVIDKDAFDYFEQNGTWNVELAKSFRETFLEKGGSVEPMKLYTGWRGQEPDSKPFLKGRGLL